MTYLIEFSGKEAETEKEFKGRLESKSPNPKNWLGKMRKLYGDRFNFNNVIDFQYRATPLNQIKK